ncbi:MAG: Ig-like domain-containing protein [Bacteroides sp.]|jgi:hypothetical protein|nr:Ig-like domain-containing protein [Bacteroides sp.]
MPEKKNIWESALRGFLIILTGLFFFACANVVSPAGGPTDETPPMVVRSTPSNFSPNFQGGEIRIYFDEFIQLKEINQNLLVSPPLENQPEVRIKGRSVILELNEELRANTTYNFFFGDAISDITESNPIPNFQFVVSTGPFVDSLSVMGQVADAFSLEPSEGIYVMLYENVYDSVPYLERPVYLSKTNKEGFFEITNMRDGQYMMFALEDLNSNFLFDLPNERIAFLDSLVTPEFIEPSSGAPEPGGEREPSEPEGRPGTETIAAGEQADVMIPPGMEQASGDTLEAVTSAPGYRLRMFLEADTLQRLVSSSVPRNGLVNLIFRVPFEDIFLRDLSDTLPDDWYIPEPSLNRDSLSLWMLPPAPDSLWLEVSDAGLVIDTLKISAKPREARGRGAVTETTPSLGLRLNASRSNPLPFFKPLTFSASAPLEHFDKEQIHLMTADSIDVDFSMVFSDSIKRRVGFSDTLGQGASFVMEILPGAFTDIYGITNDTIQAFFSTTQQEDYGMVILNLEMEDSTGSFILQLVDKDGKTLDERIIDAPGIQEYHNLLPGNYGFRMIHDLNENGVWDTGNYLKKIQPEPVYLFRGVLQIRQNWETETNWNVNL